MSIVSRNLSYSPILRAKLGELSALGQMPSTVWEKMLPLLVVPAACDFDHEAGRILTPSEHIKAFGPRLADNCGKYPIAIDGVLLDTRPQNGEENSDHPLLALFQRARNAGAFPLPVTSPRRSTDYQLAVRKIVQHDNQGAVLRIHLADLLDINLERNLTNTLQALDCEPIDVAIYLDLEDREFAEAKKLSDLVIERIAHLPMLFDWRLMFLASTEFPDPASLKVVKAGETKYFRRGEWQLYKTIKESNVLPRAPGYADYGVECALFTPSLSGPKRPSVHLRYTTDAGTLVAKSPSNLGYEGIREAARMVVSSGHFSGDNFSSGDNFIARAADGRGPIGNPSTWRCAGTSHHILKIVRDLAPNGIAIATAAELQAEFAI